MWDWEHTKLPDFKSISEIPLDSVDCTVNIANEIFSILESSNVSRSDIKKINEIVDKVCEQLGPDKNKRVRKYFDFTSHQKSEIDMLFRIFLWAVESLKKSCKDFGTGYDIKKLNQLKFKINFVQKEIKEFWINSWVGGEFDKWWSGINVLCELYESSYDGFVEILNRALIVRD